MIKGLYYRLRNLFAQQGEKGEVSGGYWHHLIRKAAHDLCASKEGTFLDIGCGEGLFLKELLPACPCAMLCGADLSHAQLLKAMQRIHPVEAKTVPLVQSDAEYLAFKGGTFTAAACINFFINIGSDAVFERLLREIHRVLKPGGIVVFDVRNARNPLVRLKYKCAPLYDGTLAKKPLRAYHLSWVRNRLESLGFALDSIYPIGFPRGAFSPVLMIKARKQ